MSTSLSIAQQTEERIVELQEHLEKGLPGYKDLLRVIHTNIKNDPDLVHILTEEQIGIIVVGLAKHKGVVINTEAAKSKKVVVSDKKRGSITVEDI